MTGLLWIPLLVPAALALASAFRRRDGWTRTADLAAAIAVLGTGSGTARHRRGLGSADRSQGPAAR